MKKIALILVITALSVFMFAAVVSADGHRYRNPYRNFQGVYAVTAKANGLISSEPFVPAENGFVAPKGSRVWGTADVAYGTFKFYRNGKGNSKGMNYAFDFFPGPPDIGPRARDNAFDYDFRYTITRDGVINVWVTSPEGLTPLVMEGKISPDLKTMTLDNAYTFFDDYTIFMASRVLIRLGDIAEKH